VGDLDQLWALTERYGVPGVDLNEVIIRVEDLDVIPRQVCETHSILPLLVRGEQIFLAMEDPHDRRAIEEIEFVTGKKVYPYAALPLALKAATVGAHAARDRGATHYLGPNVSEERRRQMQGAPAVRPLPTDPAPAPRATKPEQVMDAVVMPPKSRGGRPKVDPRVEPEPPSIEIDLSEIEVEPDAPAAPTPEVHGSGGRTAAGKKLILVVDDEADIRTMLKRVLHAQGHMVVEADTGPVALQMVKQHVPDLLILDAMLPGLHGFDVARRLKASDRYGAIPIIMISAVYRGWRVAEDLKTSYGIFAYLEKPFRLADVLDAATRALRSHPAGAPPAAPDLDALSADAARALEEGMKAYRAGNVDRAAELLTQGTKIDPLAYRLHFHLALLYGKQGLVFEAIRELEVALELHPKHYSALKNLAVLYEQAGFKNRAVEIWERAVHVAPDDEKRALVKEHLLQLL
jgi:DNA-binding response OmpR family regulator